MTTINLRDFYYWYTHDEFIKVSDKVAKELFAGKRYEKSHRQRMKRNKSQYSLDAGDGIENEAIYTTLSPHEVYALTLKRCRLCRALNSLPEAQGRRIDAHYILGVSRKAIADAEGVSENAVNAAIQRGLQAMRNYYKNNF